MILREEDVRTSLHNFMTRIGGVSSHFFDAINLAPFLGWCQLMDINREDIYYFNKYFQVSDRLKSLLVHMCKKNGGYKFTEEDYNNYARNNAGRTVDRDYTYYASRNMGDGMLTTATIAQAISTSGGFYIIYFTFDSSTIEDCKVVCKNKDLGYYLKEMNQWYTINPKLYKKRG